MTKFSVLILGNAAAAPTLSRNHTSQLINIDEQYYLMDCGEGTQLRLREHKIRIQRINQIFISHLHGDHYLGLIGLIQTMHLLGRKSKLTIYCPDNIKEIIDIHLKYSGGQPNYPIECIQISKEVSETVFENNKIEVISIPLSHRIACTGFLFREKPKQKRIDPKALKKYKIPKFEIAKIKSGNDYMSPEGNLIKNEALTFDPYPSFSYAFCSDTRYDEKIIPLIKGVDLLYHEATFTDADEKRAKKTYHSTATQAAEIAKKAKAKRLIIGHFSNRYADFDVLLNEAKLVFKNTQIAAQGNEFNVAQTQ